MTRGAHSSIFHEPCSDGRNRDIFPLPLLSEEAQEHSFVSRSVKRRVLRRIKICRRVNLAIQALNSLYFGSSVPKVEEVHDLSSLPMAQRLCIQDIVKKVSAFGACPTTASSSGALQALRVAGGGYQEPEADVGEVTNMVLELLSLPNGNVAGVDLDNSLEGPLKDMVVDFEGWMLQDASTWSKLCDEAHKIRPYDDPSLRNRTQYIAFLKHLKQSGTLGLTNKCRGRVGAFTVTKKAKIIDGKSVQRQRLILDCRQVNLAFREPPRTELGSLASLCEIELPEGETLFCGGADIQDCFYAARTSPELSNYFCLSQDISYSEALEVWGDDFPFGDLRGSLSPCITVLPMGYSWSFFLIQKLHEQSTLRALKADRSRLILEGYPAPELSRDAACAMPYCDNLHSISLSREACDAGLDAMKYDLSQMGFLLHEESSASDYFQTLGGVVDGKQGIVRLTPTRSWNILLAFETLLKGKVRWDTVRRLLGHAVTICVLNRSGMSIFRALYDFVESQADPRPLNRRERQEVSIFIGLIPLLVGDLRRGWSESILCTDASPHGYGVCQREIKQQQVREVGRWQDKWRFRHLDPAEWRPRQRAAGLSGLADWETVLGMMEVDSIDDLYTYNGYFPEVPHDWTEPSQWRTQLMGRWRDTSQHITAKEGQALVLAVRHLSRAAHNRGKRHLVLVDSFSLSMAMCKGRACSFELLRTTQKVAALSLACNFTIRTRWISSEDNVADGPSRGQIRPGAYCAPSSSNQPFKQKVEALGSGEACQTEWESGYPGSHQGLSRSCWEESAAHSHPEEPSIEGTDFEAANHSVNQKSHSKDLGAERRSAESCKGQPPQSAGEKVNIDCGGEPVCQLLHEIREFLPPGRDARASEGAGRRHFGRLHGPSLPARKRSSRRRENIGQLGIPTYPAQGQARESPASPQRMAQGTSARIQDTHSKVHSFWSGHDYDEPRKADHVPESAAGLRHLHETRRVVGPSKKAFHSPCQSSWQAVSVVLHHSERLRRPPAGQGGDFRQLDSSGQPRANVAGGCDGCPCEDFAQQGEQDFRIQHGGLQEGVCEGSQGLGVGRAAPLPIAPRRSGRRSQWTPSRPSWSKSQRPMGHRPERQTLHKSGQSAAAPEPVARRRAGVLSMVSQEHGESAQGPDSSAKHVSCQQDVFQEERLPRFFGLEIFAGTARISAAMCKLGMPMYPIDICLFEGHDVLDKAVEHRILNWIRSGRVLFVWIGMPCTSFSRARKLDGLGPGPLRTSAYLWGLPYLSERDRKKVLSGNNLLLFTLRVLKVCEDMHVAYALENPLSSMAWEIDRMQRFVEHFSPCQVVLDFCQFGEAWKKPTQLLTKGWDSTPLARRCQSVLGKCSLTHRQHIPLRGVDYSGLFLTLRAQPYPWALAELVAAQLRSTWPNT